jgi:hypothetical protein
MVWWTTLGPPGGAPLGGGGGYPDANRPDDFEILELPASTPRPFGEMA